MKGKVKKGKGKENESMLFQSTFWLRHWLCPTRTWHNLC